MLSLTNQLDEEQANQLYHAAEGFDYAVQNREPDNRVWNTIIFAIPKVEAKGSFRSFVEYAGIGYEYRVVRLSRYPPNAVVEVVAYFKAN